ncbi:hypothetical protein [Plantibacter sp. YIM 135249]|uniref:hypothetical protein n=1 Tax=Plantibacter sp. YIM 135249 TaxID=3423918 RepID=UPI003D339883
MFATPRRRPRPAFALLALPLLVIGLAACGSGDAASETPKATDAKEQTFDEYLLDFAACMRSEGIDYPDPGPTQQTDFGGADKATLDAAGEACTTKLGGPPVQEGMDPKSLLKKSLKAAKCLRAEGVDVPDPKEGDDGLQLPDDAPEDAIVKCYADFR